MAETGNLATLALSGGATYLVKSITGHEETLDDLNISVLGSSVFEKFMAGDLADPGEVGFIIQFVSSTSSVLPTMGTSQTCTITLAGPTSEYTGATIAGSGYVKRRKWPDLENNRVLESPVVFRFDGVTGPTFTNAAT
jgi:hypothetical protein